MELTSILSAKQGLNKVMGDVLRVLALYRRLWLSEIYSEIIGMNRSLGEEEPKFDEVVNAVKALEKLDYVEVKEGVRASFQSTGSTKDFLVALKNPYKILSMVLADEKLRRYNELRYTAFSRPR